MPVFNACEEYFVSVLLQAINNNNLPIWNANAASCWYLPSARSLFCGGGAVTLGNWLGADYVTLGSSDLTRYGKKKEMLQLFLFSCQSRHIAQSSGHIFNITTHSVIRHFIKVLMGFSNNNDNHTNVYANSAFAWKMCFATNTI